MNHPTSRGLLFRNYDLYDTGGEDSPGSGLFQNLDKYKSVEEFRKAKRKRNRNKRKRKLKLAGFISTADFPLDNQNISLIQDSNRDRSMDSFLSGINSGYERVVEPSANIPNPTDPWIYNRINNESSNGSMEEKIEKIFNPAEPGLFGENPPEIQPNEDQDHPYQINPYYGNTNSGNLSYPAHIL